MTNEATKVEAGEVIHPFERAGLGVAPFRLVGHEESWFQAAPGEPRRPGASCDYCGTAIVDTFWIAGTDGRRFKVGSDCVHKTTKPGTKVRTEVERKVRTIQNAKRHAREDAKAAGAVELLQDPAVRAELARHPHPLWFRAERGDTLLQWAEWMLANAGRKGKVEVAAALQNAAATVASSRAA